jgi:hypothetical protein
VFSAVLQDFSQQYCRISADFPHLVDTLGGNGMMMDSYAYPQHMKVVKHFS